MLGDLTQSESSARELASELSARYPQSTVQLYQWPWGAFCHRFETSIRTTLDGYTMRHVATYRNGVDVLSGWIEIEV